MLAFMVGYFVFELGLVEESEIRAKFRLFSDN